MRCGRPTHTGKPCTQYVAKGMTTCKRHVPDPPHPASKLTPEMHVGICEALASGVYRQDAARYNGIGTTTFYRWMEVGEADHEAGVNSPQALLWEGVIQAEAKAKLRLSALISGAAVDDWKAAAWMLERKYPEEYGRRDRTEIPQAPPPTMDLTGLSDADLDELDRITDLATTQRLKLDE
jgi:hypothetical protein